METQQKNWYKTIKCANMEELCELVKGKLEGNVLTITTTKNEEFYEKYEGRDRWVSYLRLHCHRSIQVRRNAKIWKREYSYTREEIKDGLVDRFIFQNEGT